MKNKNRLLQHLSPDSTSQLSKHISRDAVFLAPNTRLARHLKKIVNALSLPEKVGATDRGVSNSVSVLSFDSWIRSHWNGRLLAGQVPAKRILSVSQEQIFWEQIVRSSTHSTGLMSPNLAAQQAQQGYRLLRQWMLNPSDHRLEFESSLDSRILLDWVQSYEARLKEQSYISFEDAQLEILSSLNTFAANNTEDETDWPSSEPAPLAESIVDLKPIVTVGFLAPTPLQQALIQGLSASNSSSLELRRNPRLLTTVSSNDFSSEIDAAVNWAREIQFREPTARIAIVVQDLLQQRVQVNRQFEQAFDSNIEQRGPVKARDLFNISAGVPLASCALVESLLGILQATLGKLPLVSWQRLLLSRYLKFSHQYLPRLQHLTAKLYSAGELEYDLRDIIELQSWQGGFTKGNEAQQQESDFSTSLAQWLSIKVELSRGQSNKRRLPSEWLPTMQSICDCVAWPGIASLDSIEFQQHQVFLQLCESYKEFDSVLGAVPFSEALSLLSRHCQEHVFQAETTDKPDVEPVQILGGLEASGIDFDYLWLVGMSERQWPQIGRPHPLIPSALQSRLEMPSASKQREFFYIEQLTRSYLRAANEIVVSYPNNMDDVNISLSPLLAAAANELDLAFDSAAIRPNQAVSLNNNVVDGTKEHPDSAVEFVLDIYGAKLPLNNEASEESSAVYKLAGGVSVLSDQAKNPLRAYFKWRLGLRPLEQAVVGVSPVERGMIYHSTLEEIWSALRGSAGLTDISSQMLDSLIENAIELAFERVFRRRFKAISKPLLELERVRSFAKLSAWMEIESQRPEFLVEHVEQAIEISIEGLVIDMRIDRIDRLAKGDYMLIDYKSGASRVASWFESRLSEPQLPLYHYAISAIATESLPEDSTSSKPLIALASKPSAIAFASLRTGNMRYEGSASDESLGNQVVGIKPVAAIRASAFESWDELTDHWGQSLENLARECKAGFAGFDLESYGILSDGYEPIVRSASSFGVEDSDERAIVVLAGSKENDNLGGQC